MSSEELTGLETEVEGANVAEPADGAELAAPGELTENQLEALLFVAEKPL